jgi:hypothetical protein
MNDISRTPTTLGEVAWLKGHSCDTFASVTSGDGSTTPDLLGISCAVKIFWLASSFRCCDTRESVTSSRPFADTGCEDTDEEEEA